MGYSKKHTKPKLLGQHIGIFAFSDDQGFAMDFDHEHIWVWIALVPVSQNQGMPNFIEGTHRRRGDRVGVPLVPFLWTGCAIIFDARIRMVKPHTGGGVVFARTYCVAFTWHV